MPQVSRNNLIAYIPQTYQFIKGQGHSITVILYQTQVGNQVEAYSASEIEVKVFDKYIYPTPNFTFTKALNQITFGSKQANTEGNITINLTQSQIDSITDGAIYLEIKYVTSNNNIVLPKLKVAELSSAGGVTPSGGVSGNVFTIPAPLYKVQSFLYASNDLPGAGKIVLNSANPASVTKAIFNNTDERGKRNAYLENFLIKRFSEGGSDITIALTDISDTSIYHLYTVTNWSRKDVDGDSSNVGIGDGIELTLAWEGSSVTANNTFPFTVDQRIGILLDAIGLAGTGGNGGSNLTVGAGQTTFPNITNINFIDGATVADGGNGTVEVTITGGGGNSETTADVVANIAVGAIGIGDTVPTGTTLQDLVELLLLTTYEPTFVAPTFSLSDNAAGLIEIGTSLNVGLTFNFNRGSIKGDMVNGTWDANATQDFRAGASTSYTIEGNTQAGSTYTVSGHTVVEGSNSFSGTVTYGVGPQPVDSNGSNYSTPLGGGTSATQSTSFEGVYPIFLGNDAGGEVKRALISHSANNIECEQAYGETTYRHRIAIPNDMIDSRTVSWQQFNTLNNQWENISSSDFTSSSTTRTVQGNAVNYTLYTKSASIGGPASYRIVFS
jgi:hypothetical protein